MEAQLVHCGPVKVSLFFFFQAEDGIRDLTVTGVQTCALPISPPPPCVLRGTPPDSRRTPRTMPPSSGNMEPLPSVISRPPASTKRCSSASPLQPMPPVMSSDSAGVPRLGVLLVFLNGIGPHALRLP